MDDKIKLKQEQEDFKAELKVMREAALWRRSQ
ncbi:dnaJ heat shock amino-terminal domain protein, partial [Trifolium medium]|nr:dnaJ heat shock amino-terminal domain protein [Trifolium medium]